MSDLNEAQLPLADFTTGSLDVNLDGFDFMNLDVEEFLNTPGFPGGLQGGAEPSETIDRHQEIVSGLNDFDAPTNDPTIGSQKSTPFSYADQMDCDGADDRKHPQNHAEIPWDQQVRKSNQPNSLPLDVKYEQSGQFWNQGSTSFSQSNLYPGHIQNGMYNGPGLGLQCTPTAQESSLPLCYDLGNGPPAGTQAPSPSVHPSVIGAPCESPDSISDSDYSDNEITPVRMHSDARFADRPMRGAARTGAQPRSNSTKVPNYRMLKSLKVTKRNPGYVPNLAYDPLRHTPKPWGRFTYTRDGELEPSDLFSPKEIQQYLFEHPLHRQSRRKRESGLVIRVHSNPPDSANRFPTLHGSHRCRFKDCPAQFNTINQGSYAVLFDELSTYYSNHDPFLNASWVHLHCLERFCNFPKICANLNVVAEKRDFPNESNSNRGNNCMRLDKVRGVDTIVERFVEICRRGVLPSEYPLSDERDEEGQPYEGTLCYRMNCRKQQQQPSAVNRQESLREHAAGRKGATLSHHLGDLVIEGPSRQKTRRHKNQNQLLANPRQHRTYKHDAVDNRIDNIDDGDENWDAQHDDEYEEVEHEEPRSKKHVVPTAKMQRTAPIANMQRLAPRANMQRTAPVANMQSTVPTANIQRIAPVADMRRIAPTATMQTKSPMANRRRQAPAPKKTLTPKSGTSQGQSRAIAGTKRKSDNILSPIELDGNSKKKSRTHEPTKVPRRYVPILPRPKSQR
ncbi:hypothetical protein ACLMJK_002312 [Lecanora helva]